MTSSPTPHSDPWRVEPIALFGGSAGVPLDVDPTGRPHVMYCPPAESWYAVQSNSGWTREFLTSTPFGGVCGELALGPPAAVHVTTPMSTGIGEPLYGVRENGTWIFEPTDVGSVQVVDSVGRPHSAYLVRTAPDRVTMQHVWRDGVWKSEEIESFATSKMIFARWVSVDLDVGDNPRVLYYDDFRGDVRYAFRDAFGWHVEVVEHAGAIGRAGRGGQLALLLDGTPVAAYGTGLGPKDLRYSVRTSAGWTSEVVDDTATFLVHPSLAVGANDQPCLVYEWIQEIDQAKIIWDQDLLFRCRTGPGWTREVVIDGRVDNPQDIAVFAQFPDLKLDRCGNPHLAFYYNLRVGADDSGKGAYYATKGDPCDPERDEPADQKDEAIVRTKTLKERAFDRGDWRFVDSLDDAERFVWKSLGYADPFRPAGMAATPATDVSVTRNQGDRLSLVLGPAWTPRLPAYDALRVSWDGGDVTTIDLPNGWPRHPLRYADEPWVGAWEEDLSIVSSRNRRTGQVALTVHARDVSLGFTLSLDADLIVTLTFTYDVRPWWTDGAHLDPKHGHRVFELEREAADCLVTFTVGDDGDDDDEDGDRDGGIGVPHGDDDGRKDRGCGGRDDNGDDDDEDNERSSGPRAVHCRLDPRLWTVAERAELDAECAAIADRLVAADEGLARTALKDAKDAPVRNPRNQGKVDREIGKAERDLDKAQAAWDRLDFGDAIRHFGRAWEHAQNAIRLANR